MFLSLQGEGLSAGTPAAFLRLQGCDVGCHWCDSRYTWDPARGRELSVEEALGELEQLGFAPMLVVTGGEPLQHDGIAELLDAAVPRWGRVEVETSGVLPPPLRGGGLFWNVSPKLPSATPRWRETWAHAAAWVDESRATFKIVVGGEQDLDEVRRLLVVHDLPRDRVLLMPEGVTDAALRERAAWLAEACKREGLRMSPRLHVWLWGARRGV
jgi:7-carboxy-7-deazaguanine synthase